VKFDVGQFTNSDNVRIRVWSALDVKTFSFINEGTLTGFNRRAAINIVTDTFRNNGTVMLSRDQVMTVNGTGESPAFNSGVVSVSLGGALAFKNGYTQTAGKTTVNGDMTIQKDGKPVAGELQGGEVGGTGKINGSLDVEKGIVKPGNSPGRLTLTGDYTQHAAGSLSIALGGTQFDPDRGIFEYSRLVVGGTATLDGLLSVQLVNGFTPAYSESFTILTAGEGLLGSFSNARPMDGHSWGTLTFGAGTFQVDYDRADGGVSDVMLTHFEAVPEPSTIHLALSAALALAGLVWRRRRGEKAPKRAVKWAGRTWGEDRPMPLR
jgi:hypothetical protein